MSAPQLTLFSAGPSLYAQKVRVALREKKLPFTPIPPASPDHQELFTKSNPRREVPCLVHGDVSVFDSSIILEYLEEAFPNSEHLYPPVSDPAARAKVREIDELVDTQYEAVMWAWGECLWMDRAGEKGSALYEHLKSEVLRQSAVLNAWLEERLSKGDGGSYYFGGKYGFTIADAGVWTILNRAAYYGFPPEKGTKLAEWFESVNQRESIKETKKEFEDSVGLLLKARDAIKAGKAQRQYRDHRLEFLVRSGGMSIVEQGLKDNSIKFSWPQGKSM